MNKYPTVICSPPFNAILVPEICLLTSLQHLDVSSNRLRGLPHNLANLSCLKLLACDSNQIALLPDSVPYLRSLVVLSGVGKSAQFGWF